MEKEQKIFESPDRGKTIYERPLLGKPEEKKLVSKKICKYCGKSTLEVDCEYLSGSDHLSCALESESKNK